MAAAKLGLIVVPLNTRLTASELSFILSDSGTNALFFDPEFAETVDSIKAGDEHSPGDKDLPANNRRGAGRGKIPSSPCWPTPPMKSRK